MNRKAIMGIGMLMIFISTVLVASIAAGVLIRSTGLLQERALYVSQTARDRLVRGVEVFGVYASSNITRESITQFELLTRLRTGSPPLQMTGLTLTFVSDNISTTAQLNESKIGTTGQCSFDALRPQIEYCIENRLGNNDSILDDGELFAMRFIVNDTYALHPDADFEISVQPTSGTQELLELSIPNPLLRKRVRLR